MKFIQLLLLSFFKKFSKVIKPKEAVTSIYNIKMKDITGNVMDLKEYKGKKIMFVNVASKCSFAKQYKSLQELYSNNKDKLVVIGVPCNQFKNMEPDSAEEILGFCQETYNVDFPLTQKMNVIGKKQHPMYKWLTKKSKNGLKDSDVKWNFQKYLIDEEGRLIDYWYSLTWPDSPNLIKYI